MINTMTDEQREMGRIATKKSVAHRKNVDALLHDARHEIVDPRQQAKVRSRLLEMPESCRLTLMKALTGKSMRAAVNAYCQMCMGWERVSEGVRRCTDSACPLFSFRPYQANSGSEDLDQDEMAG